MRNYVKDTIKLEEKELIGKFVSNVDRAYLAYKEKANINNTLISCKFKEKRQSDAMLRVKKIIKE